MLVVFVEFEVFDGRFRCRIISCLWLESCVVDRNKIRALFFYVYCTTVLSIVGVEYSVF